MDLASAFFLITEKHTELKKEKLYKKRLNIYLFLY